CLTKEQICAIVVRAHQPIKIGSVNALIRLLRKKLTDHGIKITTLHEFGCELRQGSPRKNPRAARQTYPECRRQHPRQGYRKPAGALTRLYASHLLSGRPCPVSSGAISRQMKRHGPFPSADAAETMANQLIQHWRATNPPTNDDVVIVHGTPTKLQRRKTPICH